MYRVTEEEMQAAQAEYKRNYTPFRPFLPSSRDLSRVAAGYANLITTQNGQDADDYLIAEDNKVEKYLAEFPRDSRVLLLGVGTGRETVVAKEMGFSVVGTTLGSRNIDFGVGFLGLSPKEHIECLNETLPFSPASFDVVAGFQVFEHVLFPLLFLLEQSRVLKLGGTLLLEWPSPDKFTMGDNPHHQVCFTPGQAEGLFQKAGFGDISLFYSDLTAIPSSQLWRGDQNSGTEELVMFCIRGRKEASTHEYINVSRGTHTI